MARRATPDTAAAEKPAPAAKPAAKATKAPAAPKAAKAPAAPKAPKAPKVKPEPSGEKQTRQHFGRGWLAARIDSILRSFDAGTLKDVEAPLTVHKIAQLVTNVNGEHPSTGAVTAAIVRWGETGYIKVNKKPLAFNGFTAKWKDSTLDAFLDDQRAKSAKARAAARADKAKASA